VADVVVVGGGVGGLCAAIRLRAVGHEVLLCERADRLGGKLDARSVDGFTFETGPSLLTLPDVLDATLAVAGTRLADEVDLVRLAAPFRYRWPDGAELRTLDDEAATAAAFDALAPGAGAAYRRLVARGADIWDLAARTFFAGPMDHPLELVRRLRSPRDLVRIDGARTLAAAARRCFPDEPRLQQWLGRYATYSGSSPWRAPATLACIPAIEARHGCWYVRGGLGAVRDALVRVAERAGVHLRTGTEVLAVRHDGRSVSGVRLADGRDVAADVVVSDVDAAHLYRDLLPDPASLARVWRADRSTSGVVVLAAVDGTTPGIAHHNVWFSRDYRREFEAIVEHQRPAPEPTVYASVSSVTDPTQAPPGTENWFLLVNAPSADGIDWDVERDRQRDLVLATLAGHGVDLRPRLRWTEVLTPADLATRYRNPGGAIYGTSSNGRRAAFLRPGNRGPVRGLFLVGGTSHPGGGLPLVATSARIVADLVGPA
jgi:phytoene desaturase